MAIPVSRKIDEDNALSDALHYFEVTEANLVKLTRVWEELRDLIPNGITFGGNDDYEEKVRQYELILKQLPKIDEWKPESCPQDLDDIAQSRLDAQEIGEIIAISSVERGVEAPGKEIAEYKFKLNQKRKELISNALSGIVDEVDGLLRSIRRQGDEGSEGWSASSTLEWGQLGGCIDRIDMLLGSSVTRPARWNDLRRHMSFGQNGDFYDIENLDWPTIKSTLTSIIYEANEPIPSEIDDLGIVVKSKPKGRVVAKLQWGRIDQDGFERLMFELISNAEGYENPQWLTQTNAPDRGRDLSAVRVTQDDLAGSSHERVIIQCKHWLSKSISLDDVSMLLNQMKLWEPPRVDMLVIATSGRFTNDAVDFIEKHNQSDSALRIQMWPESHLERLLARRPHLIAVFSLR